MSGEYKISSKRGRSKVWNVFGKIETASGVEIPHFLICRKCVNIYKYNIKTTSNLVKHKCYIKAESQSGSYADKVYKIAADNATKKISLDLFTKWIVINCRPFKIASDIGLKEIAEFFVSIGSTNGPNVDVMTYIPNPTTISLNVESMYKTNFEEIKREISTISDIGYGLTSDLWTDGFLKKSYLALTIHFVKNGNICNRLLGMKAMENEKNSSQSVHEKVVKLLSEFECGLSDKAIMVTDYRGSNMDKAFRPHNYVFCISHLLQNALKRSMDEVDEIAKLCNLASTIVTYFKESSSNTDLIANLKNYSPTRWNTFYELFFSIKYNWDEISQILQENNELQRLAELNVTHLNCMIEVLELFEKTFKKLEGEKHPTLHLVVVQIDKLLRACSVKKEDILVIKFFKVKILHYLKTLVLENLNIFHKVALYLFPPANKLLQFEKEEQEMIKQKTMEIMSDFVDNEQSSNSEVRASRYQLNPINSLESVTEELRMYEDTSIPSDDKDEFDALKWWDTNKEQFPLLYKTSCRVLAVPASSASSEKVFSDARTLLTEKICELGGNSEAVNQVMFLHHNYSF